ncbi:uncharacterized protein LODBEIA_P04540 [Lodderomyces beijingensis]|uniref:Zn(2)-C6 fungal-type domain-containing protein n=1 Tax=Lodderomyces beijingensis TaxID=1775926 RepID=A0ABP0ZGD3_9ASCO
MADKLIETNGTVAAETAGTARLDNEIVDTLVHDASFQSSPLASTSASISAPIPASTSASTSATATATATAAALAKHKSSTGKRKFHQKSRHGCSTCKRRRVKCDEQKPLCRNCIKLKLDCGYKDEVINREVMEPPTKKQKKEKKLKDKSPKVKTKMKTDAKAKDGDDHGGEEEEEQEEGLEEGEGAESKHLTPASSQVPTRNNSIEHNESGNHLLSHQQQATPSLTPSPMLASDVNNTGGEGDKNATNLAQTLANPLSALSSGLLSAGNLNNLNIAHLVNNLSGLEGDLSGNLGNLMSLGNLASLSNLATLAQLPIDLSSLGGLAATMSQVSGQNGGFMESLSASLLNGTANPLDGQNMGSAQGTQHHQQQQHPPQQQHPLPSLQQPQTHQHQHQHRHQNQQHQQHQQHQQNSNGLLNNAIESPMSFPHQASPSASCTIPDAINHYDHPAGGATGLPKISPNMMNSQIPSGMAINSHSLEQAMNSSSLNMLDLKLMFHYTSQVANTITGAGISETNIWLRDIPMLAFEHPFLMHSILAFSATHLSRTENGLDQCVTSHRGDALRLLREAVLNINSDNTDALVASALILIMDSLANASFPSSTSPKSLPASAWIFHVKGAATILTAVWPLTEASRFYKFISVDLGDLGDIINQKTQLNQTGATDSSNGSQSRIFTDLECHDADIADLFPVEINSPYLITLAYLNKLHKERYKSDFILRIFAFPALLDKQFMAMLMAGDIKAMRIMRSYYKLLRSFTMEMKDKVWFLEGVAQVLPSNVEEYAGGAGGMHMMMDFLGGGPDMIDDYGDEFQDDDFESEHSHATATTTAIHEEKDDITNANERSNNHKNHNNDNNTNSINNNDNTSGNNATAAGVHAATTNLVSPTVALTNTDNLPSDITSELEIMQGALLD